MGAESHREDNWGGNIVLTGAHIQGSGNNSNDAVIGFRTDQFGTISSSSSSLSSSSLSLAQI